MNALQKLMNSIIFQTDSDSESELESVTEEKHSESESGMETPYVDIYGISRLLCNLYSETDSFLKLEYDSNSKSESESVLNLESESEFSIISDSISTKIKHIPRIVSVEGNIGAGKSTLIEELQQKYIDDRRFLFLLEPVNQWENVKDKHGNNMLQKYYDNPIKYAFAFQIMAFQTRLQLLKDALEYIDDEVTTIIMERSLDADYHIFAKMLFEEGLMEDVEFQIYLQMATEALKEYGVDGMIWLDTDYEECFRRMEKRSREGEEKISLPYLRKCHEYHIEWLGADTGFVCRIDGLNINFDEIDTYIC
jgi:deoxyadenosine/deoxycytidine kinase